MKPIATLFALFIASNFCITGVLGQETESRAILKAGDDWGKEIIVFPIEWAPKLHLEGFEELRFSPGWSSLENEHYWSLVMAWKIDTTNPLSLQELEYNLEAYFDGLMHPNHWATQFPEPIVLFSNETGNSTPFQFRGKMKFFDGFHTGNVITVNILGEQHLNAEAKQSILIFRMSPQPITHTVWQGLGEITKLPEK